MLGVILPGLAFALSYGQSPLYSSNQNSYFLHGLARAGVGLLRGDWLAKTVDPFPLFTRLVEVTTYLNERLFYVYQILLLGVYAYAIIGIACVVTTVGHSVRTYLAFLAVFTAFHSALLTQPTWYVMGIKPFAFLQLGLAGQYLLGSVLQPSVFGVFLLLSILIFLRGRPVLAVLVGAIAPAVHATYLLSYVTVVAAYVSSSLGDGASRRGAARAALLGAVLTAAIAICSLLPFLPTTEATYRRATHILVDFRLPQHARPSDWIGVGAYLQVAIVVTAAWTMRRSKLFGVLAVPAVVGGVLTLVAVFTQSQALALSFPWRVSAFLMPLSSSVLAAHLVSDLAGRILHRVRFAEAAWLPLAIAALAAVSISGVWLSMEQRARVAQAVDASLTRYVGDMSQAGDLFLVPPSMEDFRLAAGVPVLVDWKSHPFKDIEVVEWHDRLQAAESFYQAPVGESRCRLLRSLDARYGLTHLVDARESPTPCPGLRAVYRDSAWTVYQWAAGAI